MTMKQKVIHYTGIAKAVNSVLNPGVRDANGKTAFCMIIFPFGQKRGPLFSISNGVGDEDMARMYREAAQRLEDQTMKSIIGGAVQ